MRGFLKPILASASLLAMVLAGAPARSESLADAMILAYNNSPELAAARANVKILGEQAVQAAGAGRVQVQGLVNFTTEFINLEETIFPTTLQLDVIQPLYTGGQVENATRAAQIRVDSALETLRSIEQTVLLDTVTAFSDVRQDEVLVSLSRNNVRVIGEQLRAARERFDVGEVTLTDVAQAEARLAAAQSLLAAQIGSLEVSRESYKRVVGRYPGKLLPPPPIPDLPSSIDEAIAIAFANEPNVSAARLERRATSSDIKAAIGALLPQVSLLGQVSRNDALQFSNDSNSDASIGVQVVLPFYTGGVNYSNVREAQAAAEGADSSINSTMRDAAEAVGIAWSNIDVARASIVAQQLGVRAAEIAFEGVQEEAKVGARTTLDVLDAEQELLDARGELVTSRRDEYVASYSLLFAVGKLTTDHLGLAIDDGLSVRDHYPAVKDKNFGYDETDDTVWSLSYRP